MMQLKFIFILILIIPLLNTSCDIFSTRSPEEPDNSGSTFIPPTEPAIVIQNFESALRNRHLDNYLKCLNNDNSNINNKYAFIPSQNISTSFPSLFINWGIEEERRFFNSFKSNIDVDSVPILNWLERKAIIENPDSAVFESDYNFYINFSDNNIPKQYNGKLRFVMISNLNGLWSISKWYDYNLNKSDTLQYSFSSLKARLYN
ncbi:MAG TPA: hypothetical protein PLE30_06710 [Candidatus Kapabacteria bacterium]|nr:hypothetical protein [Candidatus Kapabacteria bacterium]